MPDRRRLTWTAVALLLVAACGTGTAGGPEQPGPPASAPGDPVDLVGLWTVREAAGEEPGVISRPPWRTRWNSARTWPITNLRTMCAR